MTQRIFPSSERWKSHFVIIGPKEKKKFQLIWKFETKTRQSPKLCKYNNHQRPIRQNGIQEKLAHNYERARRKKRHETKLYIIWFDGISDLTNNMFPSVRDFCILLLITECKAKKKHTFAVLSDVRRWSVSSNLLTVHSVHRCWSHILMLTPAAFTSGTNPQNIRDDHILASNAFTASRFLWFCSPLQIQSRPSTAWCWTKWIAHYE